jgi:acyl-CoA synthetase (NDP forming)
LPSYLTVSNPVDNGGTFLMSAPADDRRRLLELLLADPGIDVLVVGLTAPSGTMTDTFAEDVCDLANNASKPIVVTWNSFKTDERGFERLVAAGLPLFRSFRNCFSALRAFADYQSAAPSFRPRRIAPPRRDARDVADLVPAAQGPLSPAAARSLLEAYDIPLVGERLAESPEEAVAAGELFGWPVVMKIASAAFPHKSDAGLVQLGVASPQDAAHRYERLVERAAALDPSADIDGVLIQEQISDGVEVIVGVKRDPAFGPAVLVGMGGIFAEVIRDVAVRPLPLDDGDAADMVRSLRGYPLLSGARGRAPADVAALERLILSVAELAHACGPTLAELDLNPVLVSERGLVAVDWLLVGAAEATVRLSTPSDLSLARGA